MEFVPHVEDPNTVTHKTLTTQKVIAKFYLNAKPQKLQVYKQKGAVDKSLHT